MPLPTIEFATNMTLRQRFKAYAKNCLEGGYQVANNAAKEELRQLFDTFENSSQGMLVCGKTGTGKTMLFQILQRVIHPQHPLKFRMRSSIDVVENFGINGHESFLEDKKHNMLYDDLGAEEKGVHYGDRIEVFEKLIQQRYDLWKNTGIRTYFTSNYTPQEIEKRYGSRPISRLREMCEHIVFNHNDMRSLKNFKGFANVLHRVELSAADKEWNDLYNKRRAEMAAQPQPKREGMGERLRRQMWGEHGEIIATTSTPSKKSKQNKTAKK